jgi:cytochrome c peroxidase
VLVVSRGTSRVDVIDTVSGGHVAAIQTGLGPGGLALTDDGVLVVHEPLSRTISWYDVSGILDGTDASATRLGSAVTVAVEPLAPDVLLGAQIFHDAATREMSQDGYLACATCHPDGGTDARAWDFTDRGEGVRDTIDLRGKRGTGHGPMHWTANFDEVQDFENDIRLHFGGSGLMSDADFAATEDTLGTPKAGLSARLDALAAYVATFDRFPRSAYRNADGTLTDDAIAGRRLLDTLDCLTCHAGPDLTDSATGVRHDVGTITATSGQRLGGPLDGFDTPTLLGLHATAPYLHDGSAPTLQAVLAIPGHGDAQKLSPRQTRELVALLLQLEDTLPEAEPGCGCATSGTSPASLLLLGLVGWRRSRRGGASGARR